MQLILGNASTYTNQSVFDYVCQHLAKQGRRSARDDEDRDTPYGCLYRGPEGTMCAVGCLIPDAEYDKSIEGMSILNMKESQVPIELIPFKRNELLYKLQDAHDRALSPVRLREMLNKIAAYYGLHDDQITHITTWEK